MKKNTKTLLCLFLIFISLISCENKRRKRIGEVGSELQGKVKSVLETIYTPTESFGEVKKDSLISSTHSFYNENGQLTETKYLSEDWEGDKVIFLYDQSNLNHESNWIKANGSLFMKIKRKFDNKGNTIEEEFFSDNGELQSKNIFKYDEKGNRIEESSFLRDGKLNQKSTSKFDDDNKPIEQRDYTSSGVHFGTITFKYNDKNLLTEKRICDYKGEEIVLTTWTYDQFDDNGNYLRSLEYMAEKPHTVSERKIEYYD
jgi:hypothetical protein